MSNLTNDDYNLHEVLHMTSFLARSVDEEILQHEAVEHRPELWLLAEKACDALHDLYQAIGRIHMNKEEK